MEVGGYRLRERKQKPVRLLPLYWYQLPDDVLQQLYKYVVCIHVTLYVDYSSSFLALACQRALLRREKSNHLHLNQTVLSVS